MKRYRFSVPTSLAFGRHGKLAQVRTALVFALLGLLSFLPFFAFAQTDGPTGKTNKTSLTRPLLMAASSSFTRGLTVRLFAAMPQLTRHAR